MLFHKEVVVSGGKRKCCQIFLRPLVDKECCLPVECICVSFSSCVLESEEESSGMWFSHSCNGKMQNETFWPKMRLPTFRSAQCKHGQRPYTNVWRSFCTHLWSCWKVVYSRRQKITSHIFREGIKKNRFFLGKSPKLWVGGGQES